MNINKIGYNIMDAMAEQKVSISKLARRLGHSRETVSQWIHHPEKMRVDVFYRIAQELGTTANDLMKGVNEHD